MKKTSVSYPLDNSAIIHLAARKKNHTNSFRIALSLKDTVCGDALQEAVNLITARFPTVIAGIRCGLFEYRVVPVKTPPLVMPDQVCLAPMSRREIKTCAVRFLYRENRISIECFHAMTDGYGGMVLLNTLVAEYLRVKYALTIPVSQMVLDIKDSPSDVELSDDYCACAGEKCAVLNHQRVYQLPGNPSDGGDALITNRSYDADAIRSAAHRYGVSATAFLCAVMAASVMEIQKQSQAEKQAIQIMVPINLRKLFRSRSLRNFSFFALLYVKPLEYEQSLMTLTSICSHQLTEQNSQDNMASAIATNVGASQFPLFRILPLPLKWLVIRLVHHVFGETNSCISLSNLGAVILPEGMGDLVEQVDLILTPRTKSPYNCGVVTHGGVMSINFSRSCPEPGLETVFFAKLEQILKAEKHEDSYHHRPV